MFKNWQASFVDGAGGKRVLSTHVGENETRGRRLVVVGLEETKAAMRMLAEKARVIAEGAGALSVAAALSGKCGRGPIVAIVSGGNVDLDKFCALIGVRG